MKAKNRLYPTVLVLAMLAGLVVTSVAFATPAPEQSVAAALDGAALNVLVPVEWPAIPSTAGDAASSGVDPVLKAARNVLVPPDWPPITAGVVAGVSHDPDLSAVLAVAARNVLVPPDWPPIPR